MDMEDIKQLRSELAQDNLQKILNVVLHNWDHSVVNVGEML